MTVLTNINSTDNITDSRAVINTNFSNLNTDKLEASDITGKQDILAEGAFVDGDKTKLDGIETSADVTDATNVAAAGAIMNTGNETVAGIKTFSSSPIVPAPTTDLQVATKKYVDDNVGGDPEGTAVKSTGETGGVKFLREDGDGTSSWQTPTGGGDVTAAANLGDNLLIRGDGATKGVQNSGITIDDTDNITGLGSITNSGDIIVNTDALIVDATNKRISVGGTETTTTIGGTVVGSKITSHTEGATDLADVALHRHSDTAGYGAHFIHTRSRGTEATKSAVADLDYLSRIDALGFDGTDYEIASQIDTVVDGTVADGIVPGKIIFNTADSAGTLKEALNINSSQNATFAGTIAGSNLNGTNTGDQTTITGNAGTATALETARTIGGTSFEGTANIAIGALNSTNVGATTSAELAGVISDETGSGALVFGTSPNITTPTGIVKGDVGLGNVDNTSDTTKNSATATLTNKTLTGPKIVTTINAQTGTTYTPVLTDASKLITLANAGAITFTVPDNATVAFSIGTQIDLSQQGVGAVTLVGGTGVTINSKGALLTSNGQFVGLTLVKIATDEWNLYGDLV